MKTTLLVACLSIITNSLFAQAQSGTVRSQGSDQAAAVIELPYHPDIVKGAMSDYLSKKGKSKATDLKGFIAFRNTQTTGAASDNADLYFKVERKSRQERDMSVVSLLLRQPEDVPASGKQVNHLNMDQAKSYLDGLVPAIAAYNLEMLIKDQNDEVTKSESQYKKELDNGAELEKKQADLVDKIRESKAEQQKRLADVDAQKTKLTGLVNQRKQ